MTTTDIRQACQLLGYPAILADKIEGLSDEDLAALAAADPDVRRVVEIAEAGMPVGGA